jgi:hypothetical protein
MKSTIVSYFLLIVLTAYIVIPVLPVIDYLWNKDYIAKNLCINRDKPKSCCKGKCHLVKELKKSNANTENDSKNTEKRIQLKETDSFLVSKTWKPDQHKNDSNYLIFCLSNYDVLAVEAIFVPPKAHIIHGWS